MHCLAACAIDADCITTAFSVVGLTTTTAASIDTTNLLLASPPPHRPTAPDEARAAPAQYRRRPVVWRLRRHAATPSSSDISLPHVRAFHPRIAMFPPQQHDDDGPSSAPRPTVHFELTNSSCEDVPDEVSSTTIGGLAYAAPVTSPASPGLPRSASSPHSRSRAMWQAPSPPAQKAW